jgi:hypothetical protein
MEKCVCIHILPYGAEIWMLYDEIFKKCRRKMRRERIGNKNKIMDNLKIN